MTKPSVMSNSVSETVTVNAAPEVVYDLVADLPAMGRWSPECTAVEWRGGATGPAVGARFKGHNRHGWRRWSTDGVVVAADRGRRFSFDISFFGTPVARWSYELEPTADGCTVTERWDDRRLWVLRVLAGPTTGVADRASHNAATMRATLASLKAAAESAPAAYPTDAGSGGRVLPAVEGVPGVDVPGGDAG